MATNTIHARHIICAKTSTEWANTVNSALIPLKGEFCLEINEDAAEVKNKFKLKVGDGTTSYANLPYLFTSEQEILNIIGGSINDLDSSISADSSKVLTGITITDGKLTAKTDVAYATIAPVRSIVGTTDEVTSTKSSTTVTLGLADINPTITNSTDTVTQTDNIYTSLTTDTKGRVTAATSKKATNLVTASANLANNVIVVGAGANRTVKTSGKSIVTSITGTPSDNEIPTEKAVTDYVTTQLGNLSGALQFKGTIGSSGATVTTLPNTHEVGWVYIVKVAGTYAGQSTEVGDMIICVKAGTAASNSDWTIVTGENQVTNNNPTLSWGTKSTVGTVDGVDLTLTMPSNPILDLDVASPSASGNTLAFIDTVKQDDGKITATKKNVTVDSTYSATGTNPVNGKALKAALDTLTIGSGKLQLKSGTTTVDSGFTANSTSSVPLEIAGTNITVAVTAPSGDNPAKIALTGKAGTVTSVRVQATSPVKSSTSSASSTTLNTTISLEDNYGDTKNPYAAKSANYVLAGPSSGSTAASPAFRALVAADIPNLAWSKITSGKPTTLAGYGITDAKIASGVITLGSATITPITSITHTSAKASADGTTKSYLGVNNQKVEDVYTDILRDGNLTLVIDGNF